MYVAIALIFAVCWGGEIGESGKARLVRAYATPVIEALDRYHSVTHAFPGDLSELVPAYLSAEALHAPEQKPLDSAFQYSRDSAGYQLSVRYGGPGMNECRYRPDTQWHCSGYF
jgi:hypothetical protein